MDFNGGTPNPDVDNDGIGYEQDPNALEDEG